MGRSLLALRYPMLYFERFQFRYHQYEYEMVFTMSVAISSPMSSKARAGMHQIDSATSHKLAHILRLYSL